MITLHSVHVFGKKLEFLKVSVTPVSVKIKTLHPFLYKNKSVY